MNIHPGCLDFSAARLDLHHCSREVGRRLDEQAPQQAVQRLAGASSQAGLVPGCRWFRAEEQIAAWRNGCLVETKRKGARQAQAAACQLGIVEGFDLGRQDK